MAPSAVSPLPSTPMSTATPIKPKSILSRKRNSLTPTDSQPGSVPVKRVRVAFQPDAEESDSAEDDAAILREELVYALENRHGAGAEKYNEIKQAFNEPLDSDDAASAKLLRAYLIALINNAPSLKRTYSDLVHAVLRHHWLGRDDSFVSLFTRFLGHLISSHPGYQYSVLKMLVENFARLSTSTGRYSNLSMPTKEILQSRIHHALRYLLHIIPSASSTLAVILSQCFPFATDSKKAHVDYVRNLLRLPEYAPELKGVILDLVIERLLKIDVQVQVDVEELQEEAEDYLMAGQAAIRKAYPSETQDADDLSDSDSDLSEDDADLDPEEQRLKTLKVCVEKMDSILDLLFTFHQPLFSPRSTPADSFSTFGQLLALFRKSILPTYQSRHTQFLLFRFAQASPNLVSCFADACIQILTDRTRSHALRVSSAAYVANFTARGILVGPDMVLHVFNTLARYSDQLRDTHEPNCRGPALRKYSAYYATVQALLYIFCFRWRSLLASTSQPSEDEASDSEVDDYDDGPLSHPVIDKNTPHQKDDAIDSALFDGTRPLLFLPQVKDAFARNFNSTLNPLKVCAPEIVEEFAKIAHHLSFMYIYPVLEANKRIRLTHSAGTAPSFSGGTSKAAQSLSDYRDLGTISVSTSPATTPSASAPATPPTTPSTAKPKEPDFGAAAAAASARNVSLARRESSLNSLRGERFCQLDAYFPFDPYRLPLSKRWVVDDYREWKGIPGLHDKEADDADDADDTDADDTEVKQEDDDLDDMSEDGEDDETNLDAKLESGDEETDEGAHSATVKKEETDA